MHPCSNHNTFVFRMPPITIASMLKPYIITFVFPRQTDNQSIHTQTTITSVFRVHPITRGSMPKPKVCNLSPKSFQGTPESRVQHLSETTVSRKPQTKLKNIKNATHFSMFHLKFQALVALPVPRPDYEGAVRPSWECLTASDDESIRAQPN